MMQLVLVRWFGAGDYTTAGILVADIGPWWLAVLSRIVHILGAILFLGTVFYVGFVLQPALRSLSDDEADKVRDATRRPWTLIVMAAAFLLLVTGFYNYIRVITLDRDGTFDLPALYHPLIGVKILLALALFFLVSLLAGRSPLAVRMQSKSPLWINIILLLGVLLVSIAGVLHMLPKSPSPTAPENTPAPIAAQAEPG